ncbi:MAG TPA: zinc-binding alcohol dehydrogenase [Hyphomicrobiaceae bacterium]|nr:zinc-binding alcohol dehydrogenase [Hyphomicrobiaceae bacterium]
MQNESKRDDAAAPRRARARIEVARAIWYVKPGVAEIRSARLTPPGPGEARVRMLYSGISRGTERLVALGEVGESERTRMRAPLQDGEFPFPVKYGYCAVGRIEAGPAERLGETVFCLHPHQDVFNAPLGMLAQVPAGIPAKRATLAANMETALNALWDSGAGPGDRIVVVGAGVVGLMVASLAARLPGADVMVVDVAAERRVLVERLGAAFLEAPRAAELSGSADVVFHTSVTAGGLATAISTAGREGTIVELSWYGDKAVAAPLGGAFHSQRLRLISSQVGQVSPGRRPRWDYARRMGKALELLADARLDALVAEELAFDAAPRELPAVLAGTMGGLAPVIAYGTP